MATELDFKEFLSNISPSRSTVKYIKSIHHNIRDYLENNLGMVFVNSYLTGSYAKHTNIKPGLNDGKSDVDIVIVTSYSRSDNSIDVLNVVNSVLRASGRYKNAKLQTHSIGVEMEGIDIDIVPVVFDDEGRTYIGSSEINHWKMTDPKGHIKWAETINGQNNGKFIPIVKILKWLKRQNLGEKHGYPKGIGLEKMIADNLTDTDLSIETCLVSTLSAICQKYQREIALGQVPVIEDPCILSNDLFAKVDFKHFNEFIDKMNEQLQLVERNVSNFVWRNILGPEFPLGSSLTNAAVKYKGEEEQFINEIVGVDIQYSAKIDCLIRQDGFRPFSSGLRIAPLKHKLDLDFIVTTNTPKPFGIYWKVRNVGNEAIRLDLIRGQILKTNKRVHHEPTAFWGPHYVECYIIKDNKCVAWSHIDVPIK